MSNTDSGADNFRADAERAAQQERKIQHEIDSQEQRSFDPKHEENMPMQAGAREYPAGPLPKQHLEKPGHEADLELKPMWDAPFYKGSGKLQERSR